MILTFRNRTIHKCGLSNVCNVLEINIKLISPRDDNEKCRVEHYPQYPSVEYDERYRLGLVDNHYFINGTTNVTYYCLESYEEIKDVKEYNNMYIHMYIYIYER